MMDSHSHSHSESEILNGKKRRREEKPEALTSPEQEQGSKKKRRRKKKKKKKKEAEPNEHPQVCPNNPLVVPTSIPTNPEPNQATLPDPKVTPKKRKREKKKKSGVKSQGAQPHPEPKETTSANEPSLEMTIPTDLEKKKEAEHLPQPCSKPGPGGPTTPIKKRKSKQRNRGGRKRTMCLDAMVENPRILLHLQRAQNLTQPDPPFPISPKPVSLIDQTIPVEPAPPINKTIPVDPAPPVDQTVPVDPAPPIDKTIPVDSVIPIDTEQKTNKKKRKKKRKSDLKSEGEKPNEHNGNPPETPVQRSIDPIVPTDQTIRIRPRKNRRKKRMNALKSESDQHNADPTAEAHQGTEGVTVIKAPIICHACRQPGHKFTRCRKLKHLSKDEEICFFCGEIGHSLGKCSVSLAGGGRFAKCLFCRAHGHFSYNCPGNGHGIDPKQQVKLKGKSIVEVTNT